MIHTTLNPTALHDPTAWGYAHTAAIPAGAACVLVSGQYGSDPDGQLVSADFAAQVERAFANLEVALAAHELDLSHVAQLRTYVVAPDPDRLGVIGHSVGARWKGQPPTQTLLGVACLAMPGMLFEVEALAVR
ncbi:MAG: RidA family protein [Nannocystaceae bacterium]|nr:RidA family protein [bacterium]